MKQWIKATGFVGLLGLTTAGATISTLVLIENNRLQNELDKKPKEVVKSVAVKDTKEFDKLSNEIAKLKTERTVINSKLNVATREIKVKQKIIDNLNLQLKNNLNKTIQLKTDLSSATNGLNNLQKDIENYKNEIKKLKSLNPRLATNQITNFNNKIKQLEDEKNKLQSKISDLNYENNKLIGDNKSTHTSLNTANNELNQLKNMRTKNINENARLTSQIGTLKAELNKYKKSISDAEKLIATLVKNAGTKMALDKKELDKAKAELKNLKNILGIATGVTKPAPTVPYMAIYKEK